MTDVELELRRLGGIQGALSLLRQPAVYNSHEVSASRIELGAVILACKIELETRTRCGATSSLNLDKDTTADNREFRRSQVDAETTGIEPSGARILYSVLQALQELGVLLTSRARSALLRVVVNLGTETQEAGVASKLFGMLSDSITHNDVECSRHVSRALASGLHASKELAKQSACADRVGILLALAFPGRLVPSEQLCLPARGLESDPTTTGESRECFRNLHAEDQQARENALSCMCSISKAGGPAADGICTAESLELLFLLAIGEENDFEDTSLAACKTLGTNRAHASRSASRPFVSRNELTSYPGSSARPRTTRMSTVKASRGPLRYSDGPTAAPVVCGVELGRSTIRSGRRSESAKNKGNSDLAMRHPLGTFDSMPSRSWAEAMLSGGDEFFKSRRDIPSTPSSPPSSPAGADVAQEERRAMLATACLLACLREDHRLATPSPRTPSHRGGEDKRSHRHYIGKTRGGSAASVENSTVQPQLEKSREQVGPSSSGPAESARVAPCGDTTTADKTKSSRSRLRERKRSSSWRGTDASVGTNENHGETCSGLLDSKVNGSNGKTGGNIVSLGEGVSNHVGGDTGGGPTKLGRKPHGRRRGSATLVIWAVLERLKAASRTPELLNARCPLHQELGVIILKHGLKGSAKMICHSEASPLPQDAHAPVAKRVERLHSIVMGSGVLRSLCWLLLHRRKRVAEGAAAFLASLAAGPNSSEWALGFVEQGCVPLLRMAAGWPSSTASKWRKESLVAPTTPGTVTAAASGGQIGRLQAATAQQGSVKGPRNSNDQETWGVPQGGIDAGSTYCETWRASIEAGGGSIVEEIEDALPREAARFVLTLINREVRTLGVDRLVRSVVVSGNRELRANVALGLILLSTQSEETYGNEARRSFVSNGGLAAILGLLRSPTGRPAAVSFLRVLAALLEDPPPPADCFKATEGEGHTGSVEDAFVDADARIEGDGRDTVVLVRDPLSFQDKDIDNLRGDAEAEGIKMACPPEEVISRASPYLQGIIMSAPSGQLPVLNGRYRAWEEVMAHMGAPHTFAPASMAYSTAFLTEMFVLAATFRIESQANGYAHELLRRVRPVDRVVATRENVSSASPTSAELPAGTVVGDVVTTTMRDGSEVVGGDASSPKTILLDAGRTLHEERAHMVPMVEPSLEHLEHSSKDKGSRRRAETDALALLESSLRCEHVWLCGEVFRMVSMMMGGGDGKGLPPHPRDLTALLALLHVFISALLVTPTDPQQAEREEIVGTSPLNKCS